MRPKQLIYFTILSVFVLKNAFAQQTSEKQRIFFEKVYLHIDREFYFAGDDIWYKAYLMNAQTAQLLNTSNNLYVELIAPNASIVDRKVIRLNNGTGNGDIKLGDSVAAGTYRIRAYTNWMRNFGNNFIFEKKIQVSNSIHQTTSKSGSANLTTASSTAKANSAKTIVRFFPEGGSMVDGVAGIVAFKAETPSGKGAKVKGAVISAQGDTVVRFESKQSGMGAFMMMPAANAKYTVKGFFDDKIPFTTTLPEVLAKGFSFRTVVSDSAVVKVIISTNAATLADFNGHQLNVKARHGGIPYFSADFQMTQPQVVVEIARKDLPPGIAAITLADDQQRSYCERLVFIEGQKSVNASVVNNKTIYRSKERVVVSIKTTDAQNKPVKADLSVAAVDGSIVPASTSGIYSYYFLQSELKGGIENPQQYFDRKNPERQRQLDLLLMTQGWRDFIWKRLKDTTRVISYLNETGFTISGRVTEKNSEKPLPGINVTLFANGAKGGKLFGTQTNTEGKYFFDNINLEGAQVIKLVSADKGGSKKGRLLMDSLYSSSLPVSPVVTEEDRDGLLVSFNTESTRRKELQQKFNFSDTIALKEVTVKSKKQLNVNGIPLTSFGYPDQVFNITPKDYDYNSLSHYLLTNVNGAMPSDSAESNGVEFMSDGKKVRPIFIVDKREELFQRFDYFSLSMDQIEKIVVRHMLGSEETDSLSGYRTLNAGKAPGHVYLIYLTLKPTAFQKQELSLLNTSINGYYQSRIFYSPVYPGSAISARTDLRTTLYWNPNVATDETGSATIYFYNADPKAKINLDVQGVSAEGLPVSGTATYQIR